VTTAVLFSSGRFIGSSTFLLELKSAARFWTAAALCRFETCDNHPKAPEDWRSPRRYRACGSRWKIGARLIKGFKEEIHGTPNSFFNASSAFLFH
jgi:hypothetical protein